MLKKNLIYVAAVIHKQNKTNFSKDLWVEINSAVWQIGVINYESLGPMRSKPTKVRDKFKNLSRFLTTISLAIWSKIRPDRQDQNGDNVSRAEIVPYAICVWENWILICNNSGLIGNSTKVKSRLQVTSHWHLAGLHSQFCSCILVSYNDWASMLDDVRL